MKFHPLVKSIKKYSNIGFDIETFSNENNFYMASMFFNENNIKVFYDKEEIFKFILNNPLLFKNSKVWAHNLQFDFLGTFYKSHHFKDFKIIQRGSDFISSKSYIYNKKFNYKCPREYHYNKILFADTMSFYRGSLEEIGKIINIPKMEKPDFLGEKPKTESERLYLEKYNINDSKVTKYFADFLQTSFNNLGGEMKNTIASTSMDLFKRKYLDKAYFVPSVDNIKLQYNALYGGRTEIFQRGHTTENINVFDFNSMYPAVMKDNFFPDPNFMGAYTRIDIDDIRRYEGFCYAEFTYMENSIIPYLCQRTPQKLLFPEGKLKGYYTFFEIRNAIEEGYKLTKIGKGFYFRKSINLFSGFLTDLYKKRMELKKTDSPMELPIKIIMNSLFGKFGQKIEREEIESFYNLTSKEYHDSEPVGNNEEFYRVKREMKQREISFIIPILSAYVTAYARKKLYDAIKPIENDVFYIDTDSIFTSRMLPTSMDLGDLKLEYKVNEAYLIKPKFYYLLTDSYKNNLPIEKCRIKGVCNVKTFDSFMALMRSGKVNFTKFVKWRESLIQGLNVNSKIEIEKNLDLEDTKRLWKNKKINLNDFEDSRPLII